MHLIIFPNVYIDGFFFFFLLLLIFYQCLPIPFHSVFYYLSRIYFVHF